MSWQKCPVCLGRGKTLDIPEKNYNKCNTCSGRGIIDKDTGLPPESCEYERSTDVSIKFVISEVYDV